MSFKLPAMVSSDTGSASLPPVMRMPPAPRPVRDDR